MMLGTTMTEHEFTLCNLPSACAPTFEFNPVKKQLLGAKDGRVVIECKPRAAPRPRYTWTKGKELLFNNSRSAQLMIYSTITAHTVCSHCQAA